jgi:hypothetical protein
VEVGIERACEGEEAIEEVGFEVVVSNDLEHGHKLSLDGVPVLGESLVFFEREGNASGHKDVIADCYRCEGLRRLVSCACESAVAHGVVTVQFPRESEESELPDLLAYLDLVKKQIVRCVVRKKEAGEQERDSNAG